MYGDKSKLFRGKVTKSLILFIYVSNLFRHIIRMDGNFQISIFFLVDWQDLHFSQYHLFYLSRISSFENSYRHDSKEIGGNSSPCNLIENDLLFMGIDMHIRLSNFVDLLPQIIHSRVDLSQPQNRSTMTDLFFYKCSFQFSYANSSSDLGFCQPHSELDVRCSSIS